MARELIDVLEDIAAGQRALLAVMRGIQRDLRQGGPVRAVYSVAEAARMLGKSQATIRRMIKTGQLATSKPEPDDRMNPEKGWKQARHSIARADLEALIGGATTAAERF
jgi:hypothetical protein